MKKKIEQEIVYEGLGFPIILRNVPMIELRGVWTLDIDPNILQKVVLLTLAHQHSDLTGNQIRYIRNWLKLTQSEFGKLFGVTHPAIVKWEKTENKGSKMNLTTQRDMRLWLLDKLLTKDDDFRRAFRLAHMVNYSQPHEPLKFDVPTHLVAV
jgi:DNA-binding XRE family transcriptional regulator